MTGTELFLAGVIVGFLLNRVRLTLDTRNQLPP
jgi:hypothetical protein